mmetsp:Transcript_31352/g.50420  ORF Transcript_31352/g.50420 Transcript_31352/m.50420 type:complete len:231 (+) Transcript_31352:945-1637(+)
MLREEPYGWKLHLCKHLKALPAQGVKHDGLKHLRVSADFSSHQRDFHLCTLPRKEGQIARSEDKVLIICNSLPHRSGSAFRNKTILDCILFPSALVEAATPGMDPRFNLFFLFLFKDCSEAVCGTPVHGIHKQVDHLSVIQHRKGRLTNIVLPKMPQLHQHWQLCRIDDTHLHGMPRVSSDDAVVQILRAPELGPRRSHCRDYTHLYRRLRRYIRVRADRQVDHKLPVKV